MNDWNWMVFNLEQAAWHAALMAGTAVVALRCRDRRAATTGVAGLVTLLVTSLAGVNLTFLFQALGLVRSPGVDEAVDYVGYYAYFCGQPAGLGLVILAAFVGRGATAARSPAPSSSATGPR